MVLSQFCASTQEIRQTRVLGSDEASLCSIASTTDFPSKKVSPHSREENRKDHSMRVHTVGIEKSSGASTEDNAVATNPAHDRLDPVYYLKVGSPNDDSCETVQADQNANSEISDSFSESSESSSVDGESSESTISTSSSESTFESVTD